MKSKPFFCITLLASCLVASSLVQASELITYPSPWAATAAAQAKSLSITSGIANPDTDYKRALSKAELASLVSNLYTVLSKENEIVSNSEKEAINNLYLDAVGSEGFNNAIYNVIKYGIINPSSEIILDGKKYYVFSAEELVTREQLAVTLYHIMGNFLQLSPSSDTQIELNKYADKEDISKTAMAAVASISGLGIMNGNNRNEILPQSICNYEEALQMSISFLKVMQRFGYGNELDQSISVCTLPAPEGVYTVDYKDYGFNNMGIEVAWNEVPGAVLYAVDVLADSNNNTYVRYVTQENTYTLPIDTSVENKIVVRAGYEFGDLSVFYTELVLAEYEPLTYTASETLSVSYTSYMDFLAKNKNATITEVAYTSNEQALKDMKEITLKVWNMKNGEKVTDYKTILVNKQVADTVVKIFDEIYNGSEKFPIYAVTGYSWRGAGSKSAHLQGLAIDINPTENYYVSSGGKVYAGSYWNPNKSEYSIPANGDVVNAFSKYGWFWGGVGWDKSKDYMHFSYNGV